MEHATNRRELAAYVPEFRRFNQALEGNLADLIYLQKHPGTPMSRLPAKMNWNGVSITIRESAWMAAKQSNATQMMSDEERRRYEDFYGWLETTAQRAQSSFAAVHAARYYTVRDFDPSHLSPQQIDREIDLTEAALYEHYSFGLGLWSTAVNFPDLTSPNIAELDAVVHESRSDGTSLSMDWLNQVREQGGDSQIPAQSAPRAASVR